jgi:hypothetical protein
LLISITSTQGSSPPAVANFNIHFTLHPRSKTGAKNTRHTPGTPSFAVVPGAERYIIDFANFP